MKACPYCAEDVKDQAKVCPHCGMGIALTQRVHPVIVAAVIVAASVLFFYLLWP